MDTLSDVLRVDYDIDEKMKVVIDWLRNRREKVDYKLKITFKTKHSSEAAYNLVYDLYAVGSILT